MVATRITVDPALIQWALNITDLEVENKVQLKQNTKWLDQNFDNYLKPTVKQLGDFARRLHVPFGQLLLKHAPELESIRLAFRTQANAPAQVNLTVRDVIYEMQRKQAWFKEDSGQAAQKLSFIGSDNQSSWPETLRMLRRLLTLDHFSDARRLYEDLRRQLAQLGVLSMQKGGAGLGTNRPLKVEDLRAFVLLDEYAPLIFVNQKDSFTARIFSLIHEFVHLMRGTDELLQGIDHDVSEERLINRVTSAFLMPHTEFVQRFDANDIAQVARYFHVSPQSAAIRGQQLGLIADADAIEFPEFKPQKSNSGGNPYNTALSYNDSRYMQALVVAQNTGRLQPTKAASLIGISPKMLDKTVATYSERETRR
ncbi:ImmA/IrrE family metallo-endopeptidase [Lacticaseibacillus sp. N501-2]|uniref:ImmA/IrrE family metallo-endopeptidase n=1 Tax=Lacticaseibacillus salsurae TaxID=3367729 RepID=UPI0038B258E1